jgi:hypothetical protein
MGRKCKCAITGEIGNTDIFIKIKGRYYKSQEIYDKWQKPRELFRKIVDYICFEFLNYQKGQKFNTILTKKINEYSFYGNEVLFKTIQLHRDRIKQALSQKDFNNESLKIGYIFGIINNNINDVYKELKQGKETNHDNANYIEDNTNSIDIDNHQKNKDISKWLGDDEV